MVAIQPEAPRSFPSIEAILPARQGMGNDHAISNFQEAGINFAFIVNRHLIRPSSFDVRACRCHARSGKTEELVASLLTRSMIMQTDQLSITRVLLVEDAPFLRYAFGRLLRMQGFEVREANDGRDALNCLIDFHPHLILTDLMMPVMNGFELIRQLRADPSTASLPIVAITADATDSAERQARQAGAMDVITKPIDLLALIARLRALPS
ncbi:response regulator [Isosphaeraceae bacterium EP7]